ncbi:MAG: Crp/Fnr family transcriptional regulator [Holophagaceae bacterium]|jgi:CRP/FNR family transcriptional regulator|nr:Crp/Fnr family transcriptional regulator [Holophagaceae bacterium]
MNHPDINFRQLKFLEDLPEAESKQLVGLSELRTYSDGHIVFSQGEKLPGVFVVSSGALKIFRTTPKDKIQVLDILLPGQCIGEAQVLSDSPAATNADARGETKCWLIPSRALRQTIRQSPIVAEVILKHLAGKILHLVPLIETLSLHSVPERVAQLILDHLGKTPDKNFVEFVETQEELAQHIGSSREALNRALRLLSDLGIIHSTFPVVRVTDANKLLRYSKG